MDIAALITWVITALGGSYLFGTWLARGAARTGSGTRLPVPVVFGHVVLAVAGLAVWIVYLVVDKRGVAWTAFLLLVPVAVLGFAMLARWIPLYRAGTAAAPAEDGPAAPAERHFPVAVVAVHGLLAVTTLTLVFLSALGVGS
ncbi:hypothetical protein [Streptomyces hoynatensis]|uniref:DUF2269 family protein n=1 Tax=Streptomyces hoynatensis TaxID=1141874 RepID=A0A3A9ZE70_9ACTN|nr:hypothetical protein [Streptomyces hoynatensis]RKN45547.1 hypothetical protein D7294_03435 [Streptomyces hoynatensis]